MTGTQEPLLVGEWEVDPAADEIRRGAECVKLEPRTMALLVYLAARPGQVVSADELLTEVWQGVIVTPGSLYQSIGLLRLALGDDANRPSYVVNIPRKGYRLIAPVRRGSATGPDGALPTRRSAARRWQAALLGLILAAGVAYLLAPEPVRQRLLGAAPPARSIAVLPFENLSPDPQDAYLADGLTEDLLQNLGRLPGVEVTARSSVFVFRERSTDVREIARRLGVRYVLDGSARRIGSNLRVSAQLVDATSGFQLWSESYDRPFADVLRVQEDIARAVTRSLEVLLTRETSQRFARLAARDPSAFDAYLRGRSLWNERSVESLGRAANYFQLAIERDPAFALSHVALAELQAVLPLYGLESPDIAFPKARAAALRALELDPATAEARATLGVVRYQYEWDWKRAEQEFRGAIALNPSYATARQWYAEYLSYAQRFAEAEAEIAFARVLDPLSPTIQTLGSSPALWSRRYQQAEAGYRAVLAADPGFSLAHYSLGLCQLGQGKADEAVASFRQALRGLGPDFVYPSMAQAYAALGKSAEARELLTAMLASARTHYVSPYKIAVTHVALGEHEAAFGRLAEAAASHDDRLVLLAVDPFMDPLRADPRFEALLRRVMPPAAGT